MKGRSVVVKVGPSATTGSAYGRAPPVWPIRNASHLPFRKGDEAQRRSSGPLGVQGPRWQTTVARRYGTRHRSAGTR